MKKKFLLSLMLLYSIFAVCQIGPVKTKEEPRERLCISERLYLFRERANNSYVMELYSDNEYEDHVVTLSLGKGAGQALNSVLNLRQVLKNGEKKDGGLFEVGSYEFRNVYGTAYISSGPGMAYTAGNYTLMGYDLDQCILCLLYKMNKTSECKLVIAEVYGDRILLEIRIPKYDIATGKGSLAIEPNRNNTIPTALKIKSDEALTDEQIQILKNGLVNHELDCWYNHNYIFHDYESQFVKLMAAKIIGVSEDDL